MRNLKAVINRIIDAENAQNIYELREREKNGGCDIAIFDYIRTQPKWLRSENIFYFFKQRENNNKNE